MQSIIFSQCIYSDKYRKKHPKTSEKGHKYTFLSSSGFDSSSDGKTSACNAGDLGSIPGSGRSVGEGNGNLRQYSCLENLHGQRILVGYSPWVHKELDTTNTYTAKHSLFLFSLSPGQKQFSIFIDTTQVQKYIYSCEIPSVHTHSYTKAQKPP